MILQKHPSLFNDECKKLESFYLCIIIIFHVFQNFLIWFKALKIQGGAEGPLLQVCGPVNGGSAYVV